jgi:hypothetical protein
MSEAARTRGGGGRERRREPRLSLSLPVRVSGQYPDGVTWEEMTTTSDASAGGASVKLTRTVLRGQAVFLALPLPKRYRTFDLTSPSYRLYAVVTSVKEGGEVGLRFLGRHPPGGYRRNDSGLFLSPPVMAVPAEIERRSGPRKKGVFFFVLKPRDDEGRREEATVADNLGTGGAQLKTTQVFANGEIIDLQEAGGTFKTRASVMNAYVADDGVWRLNVTFLDGPAPGRLLEQ